MGVTGGSPSAWATLSAARSSRTLTTSGGFAVLDRHQRRVHQRARAHGFANLDQYLAARSQQDASLPQMARELGTTVPVIRRLLAEAGISRPPQPVMTARHRRRATDQRLAVRAARLGFPILDRYLADRVVQRGWPLQRIAGELGIDVRTLRDRLRRLDLHRRQASIR
jgi:hypothetical protein